MDWYFIDILKLKFAYLPNKFVPPLSQSKREQGNTTDENCQQDIALIEVASLSDRSEE